jgi:CDP-diacylglycerol--glycerol-3-phosphate 3-phosphatidyltransferase
LVQTLAVSGISANQVTLAALLLSFLGGASSLGGRKKFGRLLLMPVTLFLRMALNAIDGMLAREYGMKSRLGAILQ